MSVRTQPDSGELIVPGIAILVALVYWIDVHDISRPGFNLMLVGPVLIAIVVLSVVIAAQVLSGRFDTEPSQPVTRPLWRIGFAGLVLMYLWLFSRAGFIVSTALFVAAALYYLGVRTMWIITLASILTAGVVYVIFAKGLSVRF